LNCFTHDRVAAVGICSICQKAICRQCVGREAPRLACGWCIERGGVIRFDYASSLTLGSWPLVHICMGMDQSTMRPKIAKGVIAVGNIAVGGLAMGGIACGLLTLGGPSIRILCALGGAAVGLGLSIGGLAVGSVAFGGAAFGFLYAIGGAAFGPAIIDGRRCDEAARLFVERWLGEWMRPPTCR
jgi:hypothetical protein